jgi:serine protease Do
MLDLIIRPAFAVTDGIISTENEALSLIGADGATSIKLRVFRTSAAINEGNSGGGLYDKDGRLVGVVVAKKTGEEIDNMAYAIPSNLAIAIADILIEGYTGAVTVGYAKYDLGITVSAMASGIIVDPASGALIKEERVRISSVAAGSALESLVKVDDIITSVTVDGKTTAITATHLLSDAMLKARLGSTVTVTVLRDGKSLSHTVEITDGMKITVG